MQKLHIESVQVQNSIFLTLGRIDGLNDATKFGCPLIQDVRNLLLQRKTFLFALL